MRRLWLCLVCLVCLVCLCLLPLTASAQSNGHGPKISFDENKTPLQKALEASVNARRHGAKDSSPDCTDAKLAAIEAGEQTLGELLSISNPDKDQKTQIRELRKELRTLAKDCKGPAKSARKVSEKEMSRGGKRNGKRLVTETIIDYESADQRGPTGAGGGWPALVIGNLNADEFANRFGSDNARVLGASFLAGAPVNNDGDCIDSVTDAIVTGCVSAGVVRQTLTRTSDGCLHENGTLFSADPADGIADDCFDDAGLLKTTLRELVDEDWPDGVDQDKDGLEGEDGPDDAPGSDRCGAVGGKTTAAGCDLTGLMIAEANKRAMAEHKVKVFKADEYGVCDDTREGKVSCGSEQRRVKVSEVLTARCREKGGKHAEFVDGQCVMSSEQPDPDTIRLFLDSPPHMRDDWSWDSISSGQAVAAAFATLSGSIAADPDCTLDSATNSYTCTTTGMMGFTVIPPVWEWGFEISEDVCIDLLFDEFCFEIFYARIGYEFDFAAGLRLPVDLTVSEIPTAITAGQSHTFKTELKASDNFKVGDYKKFCNEHDLPSSNLIGDCDAFAEAEFLSSLDFTKSEDEKDGGELIARLTAFAGLQVRLIGIPLINWALDVDVDLPKFCTLNQIRKLISDGTLLPSDLLDLGTNIAKRQHLYDILREALGMCGSFETPFGYEKAPLTGLPRIRSFPFAEQSIPIPADCSPDKDDVATTGKDGKNKKEKICTGLILGAHGASLGVGMEFVTRAGSTLIQSVLRAAGDSCIGGGSCPASTGSGLDYSTASGEGSAKLNVGPINFDNYSGTTDEAELSFDNLLYHLNAFGLEVKGTVEFGGILSPLPDLLSITLLSITLDLGPNSPIRLPQHNGTHAIKIPVFVENYALAIDAKPAAGDPNRVDDNTLAIKPGQFGEFRITSDNLGSVTDSAFNFVRLRSNQPNQTSPFRYFINLNTDFDCRDHAATARFRGYPYDNVADDCYTETGVLRADRTEAGLIDEDTFGPGSGPVASRDEDKDGFADEDPPDQWPTNPNEADFKGKALTGVPAHARSSDYITLSISPFQHPLTRPGIYPLEVQADSAGATTRGMAAVDPQRQSRLAAFDTVFIKVESFLDPRVALDPAEWSLAPGNFKTYQVEGANYGNIPDTVEVTAKLLDSNKDGCTLTTKGSGPGCPDRAEITAIPMSWLSPSILPGTYGPFEPLGSQQLPLTILIPPAWASMENVTYEITFKAKSTADPSVESEVQVLKQHVQATKQSMTRYIGLEIRSFIEDIQRANTTGVGSGGLLPMMAHPIESSQIKALDAIMQNDSSGATRLQQTMIKVLEGFIKQLTPKQLPAPYAADWMARATAILADLRLAAATQ